MYISLKSRPSLKLDHMGLKTRLPDQILEKLCVHIRSHIFNVLFIKLAENIYLSKILVKFEIADTTLGHQV